MAFLNAGGPQNCTIEGCPERAETSTAMRVHFFHRHVQDTVIILEEGNLPNPRCPHCNMLVPWRALNRSHLATTQCTKGEERKRRQLAEEELRESSWRTFQAYGELLETVTSFKYLGWVLTAGDDKWTAVAGNLRKARKSWVQMTRILIREGADPKVSGLFFKAVVLVVLIFGAETCVLTPRMEQDL